MAESTREITSASPVLKYAQCVQNKMADEFHAGDSVVSVNSLNKNEGETVNEFSESVKFLHHQNDGLCTEDDEDCRKKRCMDRYDSSESSDSGVAVLSFTDCSGSSTSSDITDPGSPFSTASEDSGGGTPKMPPAQLHHSPWPWQARDDGSPPKNASRNNNNYKKLPPMVPKMLQGKITEYFKTQAKANAMRKQELLKMKAVVAPTKTNYRVAKKLDKTRRLSQTVPRKILPAPSKGADFAPFTPTMTLTAVFPPNLTYLHTKTPKPPDNLFLLSNPDCLKVIQPVQSFQLGTTVVPIVTLNPQITLSVDTAVPTVLPARPKVPENVNCFGYQNRETVPVMPCRNESSVMSEEESLASRPEEPPDGQWEGSQGRIEEKSPSPVDSDSGISSSRSSSLEISVDEQIVDEPIKSPILSQPKTIRFPALPRQKNKNERDISKSLHSSDGRCRWSECSGQFDASAALLEHLQVKHVISQAQTNNGEQYTCLWKGCKVFGRTSCSVSWLERHVLAHAGTKPFRCIVDGCGQRFNSQNMLERHVNSHFNTDGSPNNNAKKNVENGPVKLFKRNGRIIRFRRQPWSARMFDFIDSGIMEGLQHKLLCMSQSRTLGQMDCSGEMVNMHGEILARRTDKMGEREVLVRWHPADVTPDEWISEKEYKPTKAVAIPSLSPSSRLALGPALLPSYKAPKHRRKPLKANST